MKPTDRKQHWEKIYRCKQTNEVSWFQPKPEVSLSLISRFAISKTAKIIDVGGGDSLLVDYLLDLGFKDITVLDISETALEKAKKRLGSKSNQVKWLVSDIAQFKPTETYELWHDRAAFHFLTAEKDINNYVDMIRKCIRPGCLLILGTFSEEGPEKCCGLNIQQYSETSMTNKLKMFFGKNECQKVNHMTPTGGLQNFLFCSFTKNRS